MFDTAGSRLNFPVVAGVEETFRVSFFVGGAGMSVLGATFQAGCYAEHGDERGELVAMLPVEHDSAENKVLLTVPELAEGHYWWELRATDAEGKECRLLYGTLTALTSAEVARLGNVAEESELRELAVEIGGGYAKPLILRWQACSVAASLAADAARAAERAEDAAERAEDAEETVLGQLSAAQAFMESFNAALFEAIRVVDNYLWVGGVNTGHVLRGEDGVTPHIGTDGCWYVGVKKLSDRPAFGQDGITPHITADGFWGFGEFKSTVRAEGRDGLDGSAVRRILVGSYEEIPQSGETCNGGFLYLVKNIAWTLVGDADATSSGEWEGWEMPAYLLPSEFTHLRVPGTLNANGTAVYLLIRTTDGQVLGVSKNAVTWAVGDVVTWEFAEPVRVSNGKTVQMLLRTSAEPTTDAVPYEGITLKSLVGVGDCRLRYHGMWYGERAPYLRVYGDGGADFYDYYAWVESASGAGWVRVARNNDIATARVYGVMKYGTDMTVVGGAPVGRNAEGQACVPIADPATPGAVLPSSAATASGGGLTHVGSDRKLYVGMADPSTPGVGKTSYTQVVPENTNSIGLTEEGKFAVPRAAAFQWGVSKVGSSVPQSNGMPWIIPVGAAADGVHNEYGQDITGQLMNNVLVGGALRTATKSTWLSWGPNGINVNLLPEGSNAVGLMTSRSFRQSAEQGLELVAATNSLLGGVTICETIGSGSGLVPTVDAVLNYLERHYYSKTQVYSRDDVYSKAQVDELNRKNKAESAGLYKTIADAKKDHDALESAVEGRMRKTATVEEIRQLTLGEYQALATKDERCLYLVTED